jgi:hypothetical protein
MTFHPRNRGISPYETTVPYADTGSEADLESATEGRRSFPGGEVTPMCSWQRRAVTVGTTLALALAGAEVVVAPAARALAPVVVAFLPLTGPVGTSVTITGTDFADSSVANGVAFNGTSATSFSVDSNTQITAIVPAGATTGPVTVTDGEGTGTSAVDFVVTPSPPPTVLLFAPSSGPIGTTVTITGTGYTGASIVKFHGRPASFDVNSDTEIVATVPKRATTGPVSVTTPGGTGTSLTDYTVTPPASHARSVSLRLRLHLVATGRVMAAGGFDACEVGVVVKIQRRGPKGWHALGRDTTGGRARYREHVVDRAGMYRSVAPRRVVNGGQDLCLRAVSPVRTHR